MATKSNASIDKMLAKAEAKIKTSLTEISTLIRRDFKKQAQSALELYYAHYNPRIYKRTGNLLNNSIDEDIGFDDFNLSTPNMYGGFVHFTSNDMNDYVNPFKPSQVKAGAKEVVLSNFMSGIHGSTSVYVESDPAFRLMEKFQDGYKSTLNVYFLDRGFNVN